MPNIHRSITFKNIFLTILYLMVISTFANAKSVQEQMQESPAVKSAVEELVLANHILFDQNAVDAYGHISVRNPINPNTFFLARSVAPSVVKVEDIIEYDMEGHALNGDNRTAYGERFIHSALLRNHPEMNSVIHGHAAALLPYGLTGTPLRPVYHMSSFLGDGAPIFEIRKYAKPSPDTDMFISNSDLGDALSKTMGSQSFVLMRGHGYAVGADSIRKAVFRAIYAIQNANIQTEAMKMGKVQYLTPGESVKSQESIEKTINRPWQLWTERVR
jgi:HCOMODA/2-hydroxy-3-carboxy-muconic semialdehyde decarboxylase